MSEQNEIKPRYSHAVKAYVSKVTLELFGKNSEFVNRVRLDTDLGSITHRPKKRIEELSKVSGFDTVSRKTEMMTVNEFIAEYPEMKKLNELAKNEPQLVHLSFVEIMGDKDSDDDDEIWYKFMRDYQFKNIYCPALDTNNEKLQIQLDWAKKFKERDL